MTHGRGGAGALAALAALLLAGCGDGGALRLREWRLAGHPVLLPAHLSVGGPRYQLERTVELSPSLRGRKLVFAIPYLPGLVRLLVDGRERPSMDNAEWDVYRSSGPHRFQLEAAETLGERLELAVVVDNQWTQSAWVDSVPRLSRAEQLDWELLRARLLHLWVPAFTAGAMLLLALVHFLVWVRDRQRSTYGWFALQTVTAAQFPLFKLGLTQLLWGRRDASVLHLSLCVSLVASIYFLHAQFRMKRPPAAVWSIAAVGLLLALLSGGPMQATRWSPVIVVLILGVIVYYAWVSLRLLGLPDPPMNTRTVMWCWLALGLLGWPDFAAWSGAGGMLGTWHGASLGLLVFMVLQSSALSREHNHSLTQADRLNAQLSAELAAARQRGLEIEALNQELKRQIEARARQLGQALTRLLASGPPAKLAPGRILSERYRVLGALGSGAMGAVYEVERLDDGAHLALKVLTGTGTPAALARFTREAEIAAQLDHPNLVAIRDVDVTREGELVLVMELVRGPSLDHEHAHYGDTAWALPVLRGVAAGLAAMHARGVVHRDLKPANVLLAPGHTVQPKIGDFGISSLQGAPLGADAEGALAMEETASSDSDAGAGARADTPALTRTGNLLGTPAYMAPELFGGARDASSAADVYSFAVMAYQLLTGQLPYREPPLLARMRGRPVPALRTLAELGAALPAEIVTALERGLAEDPEQRPSAAELERVLAT